MTGIATLLRLLPATTRLLLA